MKAVLNVDDVGGEIYLKGKDGIIFTFSKSDQIKMHEFLPLMLVGKYPWELPVNVQKREGGILVSLEDDGNFYEIMVRDSIDYIKISW